MEGDNSIRSLMLEKRELTIDEQDKLDNDVNFISDFKQLKFENDARKNWDLFYKRNTTKFFKDRHWTKREFKELCRIEDDNSLVLLEVGCGVGNFIFPLIAGENSKDVDDNSTPISAATKGDSFFYACDFSTRAVDFVKENSLYDPKKCHAFQCDLTIENSLKDNITRGVDIITCIFVLSAIHPEKMSQSITNMLSVLNSNGCILFRDYAVNDHGMLRFKKGHKLSDRFYVRQDGTRTYYFEKDELSAMFTNHHLVCESCDYIERKTINKKEGIDIVRVFVQAVFRKI